MNRDDIKQHEVSKQTDRKNTCNLVINDICEKRNMFCCIKAFVCYGFMGKSCMMSNRKIKLLQMTKS